MTVFSDAADDIMNLTAWEALNAISKGIVSRSTLIRSEGPSLRSRVLDDATNYTFARWLDLSADVLCKAIPCVIVVAMLLRKIFDAIATLIAFGSDSIS
jgi:hypothetical protein